MARRAKVSEPETDPIFNVHSKKIDGSLHNSLDSNRPNDHHHCSRAAGQLQSLIDPPRKAGPWQTLAKTPETAGLILLNRPTRSEQTRHLWRDPPARFVRNTGTDRFFHADFLFFNLRK